jgi:DNA-binding XRE family transcriptional regulator
MSQNTFAELLNVDAQTVQTWEQNKTLPQFLFKHEVLYHLAIALVIAQSDLLFPHKTMYTCQSIDTIAILRMCCFPNTLFDENSTNAAAPNICPLAARISPVISRRTLRLGSTTASGEPEPKVKVTALNAMKTRNAVPSSSEPFSGQWSRCHQECFCALISF